MPRNRRPVMEGIPLHIIQRGNDRRPCFFSDADYLVYLDMLRESIALANCKLHAYVLMSNHVHLLMTPGHITSAAELMKRVGERYVQYVNRRYKRYGTLWQGRFKSCLVQDDGYLLTCHRYIELNPVRACMVARPSEYRWSSHQHNAHGVHNPLLQAHSLYTSLAPEQREREAAYRKMFADELSIDDLRDVRESVNSNTIFGSESFAESMESAWGNNILPRRPGRVRD